uniref:Disease resistance R13L4/SHOC-2-like LRR domain-containing protein n=1 Tax=Nelumbo nucifera TaxID=4432 RepID=A0A822ZPT7_NELNU|nr:TPA_asm: hypothetical protein HUJ06_016770 [Nelumbo nucifera]
MVIGTRLVLNDCYLLRELQIVRGCKGFPLAVKVIAQSLRGQPLSIWKRTERILSKGPKIPASALLDIWVELYKLNDESDAYNNLLKLSTQSLVTLLETSRKDAGEIDGRFNELFILQHDLLRDLRLVMERREDGIPSSWMEQENQPLSARLVSIITGEMHASSWCSLQLPEAEVLILDFLAINYSLPPFMEKMGKLKVLILANHGHQHAKLNDLQALSYLDQLKRIRLEKISVPPFPKDITFLLKNLQKISLVMCEVRQALENCTGISNMLPNLIELDIDYCNDLVELPSGICNLVHLQNLRITNCHNLSTLPEKIGFVADLQVLCLHACTGLLELPDSIGKLQKLRLLDLSDCLSMEKMPGGMGELSGLRKLDMTRCSRVRELPCSAMNLECLEVVICDEETATLWEPLQFHLSKLNVKVIKDKFSLNWLGIDLRSD